mmetsp:Transcript_7611/g.28010  ORF Transcript_7611/g.28010 Transcript_7611/m.28010 type:complete len:249 (+) Transcript_7611:204-950(+)
MSAVSMTKKRKFVADGIFYAEVNEFFSRELGEDGYAGVEVRVTPMRTEVIIRATRTQNVLGEKGRRIRELTSLVQKRFKFAEGTVELYAEKVNNRGLCASAQCESLRYKLLGGLAVRRACYGILRFVMESGTFRERPRSCCLLSLLKRRSSWRHRGKGLRGDRERQDPRRARQGDEVHGWLYAYYWPAGGRVRGQGGAPRAAAAGRARAKGEDPARLGPVRQAGTEDALPRQGSCLAVEQAAEPGGTV